MRKVEEMYRDKTDEKILEFLQKDSRESFVEIGKKTKAVRICNKKKSEKYG